MTHNIRFITLLFICSSIAQADVFKCTDPQTKRALYQAKPCVGAAVERRIEMKNRSVAEEAAAAERLRNWQARKAEEEALKEEIAKERWEAHLKAAEVEAAQRNVAIQRELVRTQQRLAGEMSRRPVIVPVQSDFSPASADTRVIQVDQGARQGLVAIPAQPGPVRAGTNATRAGRWGTTGR
ncbi:hypothetical protein [Methylobacter sp. BlB1]|uniref:hypothetical protein n=1 Tax=Methylobacter sp. BlB1 TaxID=2785914 RepID=UPI001893FFE5|nr:hypothetical protein [Methylobacter sp. BlB1]MBF6649463.1 hypothetical protein [Methylobacter sp. BlB1]